ncbi:MAG: tetratricopeptide repeat protein [Ferruginibacter sp.]
MKHLFISALFSLLMLSTAAQNTAAAKQMIYYERYQSAIKILEPILAADSWNTDAAYWLVQACLQMPQPNLPKARKICETGLKENPSNVLLHVALGHVFLYEKNETAAKAKIKTAEVSAAGDAAVYLAIARAVLDNRKGVELTIDYAIGLLNKALTLKEVNKAEAFTLMGNLYHKKIDAGKAHEYYQKAVEAESNYALAYFRLGKLFATQRNDEVMLDFYTKAWAADPAFAPVYLALYNHYSYRDVNKAKEYLDKYIANTDTDCNTDLFYADYLFRSGKYVDALSKSAQLEKGKCNAEIGMRLKVLNAYCYTRLNDSLNAKKAIESFLMQEKPERMRAGDFELAAMIFSKFVGSEARAVDMYNKAYDADSAGRLGYLQKMIELYKRMNDLQQVANTWDRIFAIKPRPSNLDLFNRATAYMAIKRYGFADTLWQQYKEKYPDQIYGYTNRVKCNEAMDSSMQKGLAVPHLEALVAFALKDTVKYKPQLLLGLNKLVVYYVNIKKDKARSIAYLTQYLLFDPANKEAEKILNKLKEAN